MKQNHLKAQKFIVIALFLIAAVLSVLVIGKVTINYNISDYLDGSTETKISLTIIEDEFGQTGNIQVMVEDISKETALEIRDTIKSIEGVLTVSFNENSTDSFKDGDALFVVLVDGDDYSETANDAVEDIKAALDQTFEGKTHYGGTVVEKKNLRSAIENEIVFILAISVCLVTAIMLLTSRSWLEPIILWLASGVAVLLNLGTNIIFDEISYITNAVAAILQLALSIDYSIVLLHHYRSLKDTAEDHHKAMLASIKAVLDPVSASALTTVAGLLALLFMTLKIGFDIGIVLMKGIIISAITSLTLFPALLLLFEKLLDKTKKRELVLRGKFFSKLAFKGGKVILPIALALILVCGVLQIGNTYSFTDSKNANQNIISAFGQTNSVVVVYKNTDDALDKEASLAEKLLAYKTADGTPVLKNHTAYTNTVRELYDVDKAAETLDLDPADVEMLFTMYHLYGDPGQVKLTVNEFMDHTTELLQEDPTARDFGTPDMISAITTVRAIRDLMNDRNTAEAFQAAANACAPEGSSISLFPIRQMYGLYYYDRVEEKSVDFTTMLDFMLAASTAPETAGLFDEATIADLTALSAGIQQFKATVEKPLTVAEFQGLMYQNYGMPIDDATASQLYAGFYMAQGLQPQETIPYLALMNFLVSQNMITDPVAVATIDGYNTLFETVSQAYPYEQFLPILSQVATGLTGETPDLTASPNAIQQLYILYFYANDTLPVEPIEGRTFVAFVMATAPENDVVNAQLSEQAKLMMLDMVTLDSFTLDPAAYTYPELQGKLAALTENIHSMTFTETMSEELLSGIYIKYAMSHDLGLTDSVMACDLVDFVLDNMDENALLKARMTDEAREGVQNAREQMDGAAELLLGENYSRMLLSVALPNESEESTKFVEYLTASVQEIFGEDAHVAGEMISTYDLQKTFDGDDRLITIFTIISIFIIVMLIFRSLSLPVLLVAIIQGAIWISMSTSLLTGPMFFMSYIIATCILMGATIDYGILMSSSYVEFRSVMDKKEALLKAVEAALPTVFTSGLILTVCGFVVSFISSQTSISTVGFLLGKGTIVSCLMITLVLPSALYLLDGFILKLTIRKKNK